MKSSIALLAALAFTAAAPALPPGTDPAHLAFPRAFAGGTLAKQPRLFAEGVEQITDFAATAAPRGPGGQLTGNRFNGYCRAETVAELTDLGRTVKGATLGECRPLRADTVLCGYTVGAPDTLLTVETTVKGRAITRVAATMVVGKLDGVAGVPASQP